MARSLLKNNGAEYEYHAPTGFDNHNIESGLSPAPVMIAAAVAPVFNLSGVAEMHPAGNAETKAASSVTAITDTSRDFTGHIPGTIATTNGEPDIYDSWSSTTGHISINHSVSSAIDSDGDTDWFAFNVNAGYIYSFDLAGTGDMALSDPMLKLYDTYGNLITFDDDSGPGINAHLSFYADSTGVLYISAEAFPNAAPYDNTGYYTLTMGPRALATQDTVGNTLWDHGSLTVGTRISGRIDQPSDHDWYAVDLTAGQGYDFDITGVDGLNTFIRVYDTYGNLIAQNDDSRTGTDAHLDFEAMTSGTYYISAETSGNQSYGAYSIKVSDGARPLLTDSIDWGTKLNVSGGVVKVYFAASGEVFDGQTSHGWSDHEIAQAMAALGVYSNYINLTFVQTTDASEAQFKLVTSTDLDDDVLAYMNPPGTTNAGVGVFAINTPAWTTTTGNDPLLPGGLGFDTLVHELGHGLGLAHPFDNGGGSPIMNGVLDTYDYYGYGIHNQGIYTIMSYNDGWPGNYQIPWQVDYYRGYGETPMAIDVAALQAKYGANTTYHNGDDVYVLKNGSPATGNQTSFWSIWDTGGIDTLTAENNSFGGATLDLRAATMYYFGDTAGGAASFILGQNGGVTIDQGVIIENATGTLQSDTIIGNDYANVIKGMGGSDIISAGGGNDSISVALLVNYANCTVDGGTGTDTLTVDMARDRFTGVYDGDSLTITMGGYSVTMTNIETIVFTDGAYAFNKAINVAPVLSGTFMSSINGGDQHVLTISELGVTDANNDALTFYVQSADKHGTTDYSGATHHGFITVNGAAANTFTAAQLAAGQVRFVQDGAVDVPVSFKVAAYDGQAWSQTVNFSFVTAYNHGSYLFIAGTAADDTLDLADFGGAIGNDVMAGFVGNDTYIIDKSSTTIIEGANDGWDTIRASVSYVMPNNVEALHLTGSANISAFGNAQDNVIYGNDGNNILNGKGGADEMWGGAGDDTYYVNNLSDSVWEWMGFASIGDAGGIDTVISSVDWTAGYYIENITLAGSAISATGNDLDNILTGTEADNVLTGSWGNDTLNGGAGADKMYGGVGNDTYYIDNAGDQAIENDEYGADSGDTIIASISYTLNANVENLTLSGSDNLTARGNALDNILIGNAGNNMLNGGLGADVMSGNAGNDTYIIDNTGDVVIESNGGGTDSVYSTVSFTLGDFVENLTLGGTGNLNGKGNALNNVLVGNDGNNILNSGAGADTMNGGNGNDTYIVDNAGDIVIEGSTGGNDTIYSSITYSLNGKYVENLFLAGNANINASGNNLANLLVGNDGNNVLNGGTGIDTMNGGNGNDIYYVDNAGDVVIEGATGGNDTIYSSITYSLSGKYVENLFLFGSANVNASGNNLANLLVGNDGNNVLNGGTSADTMNGGNGNDTYYVDNAGDVVIEGATGGNDTIYSSITYSLSGKYVENLFLFGSANVNASGNNLANLLVGNDGNNILNGGTGADTMNGGNGNDTYYVDNAGDVVIEGATGGNDTILSTLTWSLAGTYVETLSLQGSANINASGNGNANTLIGNTGNNTLNGGAGNDILTGGGGNDIFWFGAGSGADTITDFSGDTINLNAYSHGVANGGGIVIAQVGGDTTIDLGGGNIITLTGVNPVDLNGHIVW